MRRLRSTNFKPILLEGKFPYLVVVDDGFPDELFFYHSGPWAVWGDWL